MKTKLRNAAIAALLAGLLFASLAPKFGSNLGFSAKSAAAAPTISSIVGVTNNSAGISNGKVAMDCGTTWNGYYAINDQYGTYTLTLQGNNFGATKGSVMLGGGASVQIKSWTNTSILIDPILPPTAAPVCAVLRITTASGAVLNSSLNIVPAIRTRIYGQCTYQVALTRLQMGMSPSPTAYGDYTTISAGYVPRPGDQYQWSYSSGRHTAIVVGVSGPVSSTGGIKTWTISVRQQNADCKNGISTYTTQFQTKTAGGLTSVYAYPKSSWGLSCTLVYAAWR